MLALLAASLMMPNSDCLVVEGHRGPGKGKNIVLLSGDEEYRSEEGLPQLARILAERHGFRCTVLFSLNENGEIDPNEHSRYSDLRVLDKADCCVMLTRFRTWPDAQMKHFADYVSSGRPLICLRTSTHGFLYEKGSAYQRFDWRNEAWRALVGETWVSHWGEHGVQGTRGLLEPSAKSSPVLQGVEQVFCTTDVYEAHPIGPVTVLMRGQVVDGLTPSSAPATGEKASALGRMQPINEPMMPIVWTQEYGKQKVLTTTMGAATDLLNEGLRRLLVNGVFWSLGLRVPAKADVRLVGEYKPSGFGFDGFRRGLRP